MFRYHQLALIPILTIGFPINACSEDTVRTLVRFNDKHKIQSLIQSFEAHATAADEEQNLCRELIALKAAKGTLLGLTRRGEAVIESPPSGLEPLTKNRVVASTSAEIPPDDEIIRIDELIVSYDDDDKPSEQELRETVGLQIVKARRRSNASFLVCKSENGISHETAQAIQKSKKITRATLNAKAQAGPPPKKKPGASRPVRARATAQAAGIGPIMDPYFRAGYLWGLNVITTVPIWDQLGTTSTAKEVIVAVVDSGIDYTHEDLRDNIWTNAGETGIDAAGRDKSHNGKDDDDNGYIDDVHGYNFQDDNSDPRDRYGHGTHVSGTIGAVRNNIGVIGVNWQVKLMALKYLDDQGGNGLDSDAIDSIDYAINNGAKVINFSTTVSGGEHPEYESAIQRARDKGILVVAAAGNAPPGGFGEDIDDGVPQYPASFSSDNILAVLAVTRASTLSDFSNFGARSVHLGAPGGERRARLIVFAKRTSRAGGRGNGLCALRIRTAKGDREGPHALGANADPPGPSNGGACPRRHHSDVRFGQDDEVHRGILRQRVSATRLADANVGRITAGTDHQLRCRIKTGRIELCGGSSRG
jgi:hypothetical protein